MFLRMGFRPMLVCSALLALAQAAPAQIKIAVVNMQQAVYATAEVKKADADLQVTLKPKQEQAQKLQTDLQAIQQQLQAGGNKLTEQQQEDLNTEGQRKQRELQRLTTELQESARWRAPGHSSQVHPAHGRSAEEVVCGEGLRPDCGEFSDVFQQGRHGHHHRRYRRLRQSLSGRWWRARCWSKTGQIGV